MTENEEKTNREKIRNTHRKQGERDRETKGS
jgi:hypothetical protein